MTGGWWSWPETWPQPRIFRRIRSPENTSLSCPPRAPPDGPSAGAFPGRLDGRPPASVMIGGPELRRGLGDCGGESPEPNGRGSPPGRSAGSGGLAMLNIRQRSLEPLLGDPTESSWPRSWPGLAVTPALMDVPGLEITLNTPYPGAGRVRHAEYRGDPGRKRP